MAPKLFFMRDIATRLRQASTRLLCSVWHPNRALSRRHRGGRRMLLEPLAARWCLSITDFTINEIHADPEPTELGDANGDGVRSGSEDEFVELVNNGPTIDIGGWTLRDATNDRHTFAAPTVVASGQAVVVFGGGEPIGEFGGAVVATASSRSLGLNNDGDTISLTDGQQSVEVVYGTEAGDDQSLTRDPDVTGDLVPHGSVASGLRFSPGLQNDGVTLFGTSRTGMLLVIESDGGTQVAEGGVEDTIEVSLSGMLEADVQVTVTPSSDQVDVGIGPGNSLVLNFGAAEPITPRTLVVIATDDSQVEGPHSATISFTAQSEDPIFDGLLADDVVVAIVDDDTISVQPGDIVVTEIMQNPAAVSDADGEYIELLNTATVAIDINGWTIGDGSSENHTIRNDTPLVIAAGEFVVLGAVADPQSNGGITVAYQYAGITLGNGADSIQLTDPEGNVIDRVAWDGGAVFPDPSGASMELLPNIADPATANDVGTNWHPSNVELPSGDRGTPGAPNSQPVLPEVSVDDIEIAEGDALGTFVVQLSTPPLTDVTIDVATADVTAVAPDDYAEFAATITFAAEQTSHSVPVVIVNDGFSEANEQFALRLSNPQGVQIVDDQGIATIRDDDTPQLTVSDVVVNEGAAALFTIELTPASEQDVSVQLTTEADTATAGDDFTAISETLHFPSGSQSQQVTVEVIDDDVTEQDEQFYVRLSDPAGAVIDRDLAAAIILANDAIVVHHGDIVFHEIMQNPSAVADGDGEFIELWNTTDEPIDIRGWVIRDEGGGERHSIGNDDPVLVPAQSLFVLGINSDTDTNGGIGIDYQYSSISLGNGTDGLVLELADGQLVDQVVWDDGETFPDPNGSSMELNVGRENPGVANDDGSQWHASTNELASGDFGTPGAPNSPLGPPEIIVQDVTVSENEATVEFIVSLARPSEIRILVDVATADDTAVAGRDYVALSTTLRFDPGEVEKSVIVSLLDDSLFDPDETFLLTLQNAVDGLIVESDGLATIVDNELPSLSISPVTANERDGHAVFRVSAAGAIPATATVTVDFETSGVSATSPEDYEHVSTTLVLESQATFVDVIVPLVDDTLAESAETFIGRLTNPDGAILDVAEAEATIGVSDAPRYSAGDLIINEVMRNPSAVGDEVGEFVELWNTTGFDVDLSGWRLQDDDDAREHDTLGEGEWLIVPAGGYFVAGLNADQGNNGGIPVDYEYEKISLGNGTDGLEIYDRWGTVIDAVIWDELTFPDRNGASMELAPGIAWPGAANDLAENWHDSGARMASGDLGTPGQRNSQLERITISISDTIVLESTSHALVGVEVSSASHSGITIEFATDDQLDDAGATAAVDFEPVSLATLSISPGATTGVIEIPIFDDDDVEANEYFHVQLIRAVGAEVLRPQARVTILNDELPQISVSDVSVNEASEFAVFELTLSAEYFEDATIDVVTIQGTATADDFRQVSQTVTFSPGDTMQTVLVPIEDDEQTEGDETFSILLSNPVGMTIGNDQVTGTIVDDDAPTSPDQIVINEVDAATTDENHEFIELYDGGVGNSPLDGLILVLFDGETSASYTAIDLSGNQTNSDGFFVVGDSETRNIDLIPPGWDSYGVRSPSDNLQNGEDVVALYSGRVSDFLRGTPFHTLGLVDAVVYQTGTDSDSVVAFELSLADDDFQVVDEDAGGLKYIDSNARLPDGGDRFGNTQATPGRQNAARPPQLERVALDDGMALIDEATDLVASGILGLVLTFDRVVAFDGPIAGGFLIENETLGTPLDVFVANRLDEAGRTVVTISGFAGVSVESDGALSGGAYKLTVLSQVVTANGLALDVDGDGVSGPDNAEIWFTASSSARRSRA